jgi:DNA polymerase-4
LVGQTVHLKIRFADFKTITRSRTLAEPTNITEEIWQAAAELLTRHFGVACFRGQSEGGFRARRVVGRESMVLRCQPIRLLGLGVSGLEVEPSRQGLLFDGQRREKQQKLDAVTDRIHDRFGGAALKRAAAIEKDQKKRP